MSILLTTDWHLTDSPHDEYRWGIFPWLKEQVKKYQVTHIIVAGDITDKKDGHSSFLTNRVSDEFISLAKEAEVILMKGNHDFIDEDVPFFKFLNQSFIDGLQYIIDPTVLNIRNKECLFLPCTRKDHSEVWADFGDFSEFDMIFCHETFSGAISETGMPLDGLSRSIFDHTKALVFSGDVHVPQKLGKITYIGSPYRIRFGDSFDPRIILLNGSKQTDLKFPCMKKHTIELFDSDDMSWVKDVSPMDQVKFRMNLKRSEIHDWETHKSKLLEAAKSCNVVVHGVELKVLDKIKRVQDKEVEKPQELTDRDFFDKYCKREKIGAFEKAIGEKFLP